MYNIGTYGGHLELTAFAHLKRRDVKVIQPGLVYVIEWTSGADLSPTLGSMPSLQNEHSEDEGDEARLVGEKEARKTRRERKQEMRARARAKAQAEAQLQMMEEDESSSSLGAVYVACVLHISILVVIKSLALIITLHMFGHHACTCTRLIPDRLESNLQSILSLTTWRYVPILPIIYLALKSLLNLIWKLQLSRLGALLFRQESYGTACWFTIRCRKASDDSAGKSGGSSTEVGETRISVFPELAFY